MSSDDIIRVGKLLREITNQTELIKSLIEEYDVPLEDRETLEGQVIMLNEEANPLLSFINFYNEYKGYLHSKFTLQNSIVSKIKGIINTPSNQILATIPVSIQQ
jgi:hypothetical protein